MSRKTNSLLFKFVVIVLAAGLLELMLFMVWESNVSTLKGDAIAISTIGSERMRLLKMALLAEHYMQGDSNVKIMLDDEITAFEKILYGLRDGNLRYNLKRIEEAEIIDAINKRIDTWHKTIKPVFQRTFIPATGKEFIKTVTDYRKTIFAYLEDIDALVGIFEAHSETKVERLRRLQFIFLSLTVFIGVGSLVYVYTVIVKPIQRLANASKTIAAGNLAQRVNVWSKDEIGVLGNSFNAMAAQLEANIKDLNKKTFELENQRAFLNNIIDSLPFNIYIVDRTHTVIAWNRRREDGPFGIHKDVVIGKKLWHIFDMNLFKASSSKNKDAIKDEFDEVFRTGKIIELEEVSSSFGEKRFFKVIKVPLVMEDGKIAYVLTAIEDITEKRQMEARLLAKARLAAIGELATGVAHEINNPLASMAVCSESLLKRGAPDIFKKKEDYEYFNNYLKVIEEEIYRAKNITIDLLNFNKERSLIIRNVNINRTIGETIKLLQLQHKYREFIVKTSLDESLPNISIDEGQLRQAFMILTINAFEAMKPGGVLNISTASDVEHGEKVVKVWFRDNGCGIPPENIDKIFRTFFTTKGGQGTGLGLSICYGIVNDHGGRIEVESKVDVGSTFTIILLLNAAKKNTM